MYKEASETVWFMLERIQIIGIAQAHSPNCKLYTYRKEEVDSQESTDSIDAEDEETPRYGYVIMEQNMVYPPMSGME